ncbi:cofactor-independent phosphoglycerate mutase [Geobacter sp. DSM 9736]|uniref:cofactor-independent phosphoglycerate mutase n=1 Tax=Geobacter sp. DSM 9736 TaxID=1277350 RepID=UPI000B5031E5|nr:cofactor-independent phosphoglycerate mutase [Geobacter sp. DSM 9736]SNB45559.1 phosphoglycerate mutase [Geobacter sp. DSM 9736]
MKYVVLLGDGMSDVKLDQLGGKTPLQAARTPHMDYMAQRGKMGLARTVPEGLPPGSDVANLSVFGYDPRCCYTGRSPLEAASMGVDLGADDVAFRVNLVTLLPQRGQLLMQDYSAGHISTDEGRVLIEDMQKHFGNAEFQFFPGVGYRHLMVWRSGREKLSASPPHDITGKNIIEFLPKGEGAERLIDLMNSSQMLFNRHPVNKSREEAGKLQANSIWLWGHGRSPKIDTFSQRFGLTGAVISAVDLIKGIGICAGLDIINVPGATGYIDTNYRGKAEAALKALEARDFVYLHVEAPDEASHSGNLEHKLKAIEDFDELVVGPVLEGIRRFGSFRILCTPDHPTPIPLMTHTGEPVPFVIYSGEETVHGDASGYDEAAALATGLYLQEGHRMMELMLRG